MRSTQTPLRVETAKISKRACTEEAHDLGAGAKHLQCRPFRGRNGGRLVTLSPPRLLPHLRRTCATLLKHVCHTHGPAAAPRSPSAAPPSPFAAT
eukprot:14202253-Alexandrium_andersonii.AAC.1